SAGRVGLKLFSVGSSYVAKTISRFTGTETLQELATFMLTISGLNEGFRERAHQTRALLAAKTTAFVLVTGPMQDRMDEAIYFHPLLKQTHLEVAALVANRVHQPVPDSQWAGAARLSDPMRRKMELTLEEAEHLAAADIRGIERLQRECPGTPLITVPRF